MRFGYVKCEIDECVYIGVIVRVFRLQLLCDVISSNDVSYWHIL